METYYDAGLEPLARFRIDPPPLGWVTASDGWRAVGSGVAALRLSVTSETIEVTGLRKLLELTTPGARLVLPTRESTVWTVRLSRAWLGPWFLPKFQKDYVALSFPLPDHDDAEYTLAIRPSDGDLDRLKAALKSAGAKQG